MSLFKKIFSLSNIATLLTVFYLYTSLRGIYNLMNPLNSIDISSFPLNQLVKPYWKSSSSGTSNDNGSGSGNGNGKSSKGGLKMQVYLSTNSEFNLDFVIDDFQHKQKMKNKNEDSEDNYQEPLPQKHNPIHDSILLWEESSIPSTPLSKAFILTTSNNNNNNDVDQYDDQSPSFQYAIKCLDDADKKEAMLKGGSEGGHHKSGGSSSATSEAMNALLSNTGDGIETTSLILTLYKGIGNTLHKLLSPSSSSSSSVSDSDSDSSSPDATASNSGTCKEDNNRVILPISKSSSIWSNLMKNSTVNVHVILLRDQKENKQSSNINNNNNFQQTVKNLQQKQQSYDMLTGGTDVVKYDLPHHITKPKRFLYKDIIYIFQYYILQQHKQQQSKQHAPWEMEYTKPKEYKVYQTSVTNKEKGIGYPYWKPEVAVKLVSEDLHYPVDYVGHSGMEVIRINTRTMSHDHASGYAYLPGLYVDEMGLTSEKYIPLNSTVDALPLRISFDSGSYFDGDDNEEGEPINSSSGLSPGRWRLLSHLSRTLESQKDIGFDQSDIDDIRRLIADTNVTLLGITILASTLHLLFEFLTFKNDVEFWQGNKDLTGLSVRALFMDFFSQFIILLFLFEQGSSLLMTIPAVAGCLIALWKCQKGAGFKFVKRTMEPSGTLSVWNKFFRLFGYELHAMRLRAAAATASNADNANKADNEKDLATLTEEMDSLATRTIGKYLLLPLVLVYTVHTLINEEHSGWYSWFITSASAVVYAVGFVMMTPQLFLNYKLKSVAHLPWKVLGYRFVNTFIDDLFAMIIRMPTMARISCFRDDIVFMIYLWQRYCYPVDTSRPVEGGGMDAVSQAATSATIESTGEEKKEKSNKKKKEE